MNYQPLLRNYRQMVRIVRDKANSATSYTLGNAYGEEQKSFSNIFATNGVTPTELQIRTLNEMNVPSTSPRRPGATAEGGYLSPREGSTLYHDLNDVSKQYLNALGGEYGVRRSDGQPGTKLRTQLGVDSFATKVYTPHGFIHQESHLSQTSQHLNNTPISRFYSNNVISNQQHLSPKKQTEQAKPSQTLFNAFD